MPKAPQGSDGGTGGESVSPVPFAIVRDSKSHTKLKFLIGSSSMFLNGPHMDHIPALIKRLHDLTSNSRAKACPMHTVEVYALESFGHMLVQMVAAWREEQKKEWNLRPK